MLSRNRTAREVRRTSIGRQARASGSGLVAACLDVGGQIEFDTVTDRFGLTKAQLAETLGLSPAALQRTARAQSPKAQARVTEMLEIVARISAWAGGERQAFAWYRAQPLPPFGGRTAEYLVRDGKAGAIRQYLDHVALGGFA